MTLCAIYENTATVHGRGYADRETVASSLTGRDINDISFRIDAESLKWCPISALSFDTIAIVLDEVCSGGCVVWDVDNTLTVPEDDEFFLKWQILCDQYTEFKKWLKEIFGEERGGALLLQAALLSKRRLTDKRAPVILSNLARRGISAVTLTAAGGGVLPDGRSNASRRVECDRALGLDFKGIFGNRNNFIISPPGGGDMNPGHQVALDGEIFCGGVSKDVVLEKYWEHVGFPLEVVFIDDRLSNIRHVQAMCVKHGIKFTGIHYIEVAEKHPGPFDEELAKFKFHVLNTERVWLTDFVAKKRMAAQRNNGGRSSSCFIL